MNENRHRISAGQLAAMLLVTDAFVFFCIRGSVSSMTALGAAAAVLVQSILSVPLIVISKRGIIPGKAADMLYFACLVLWGGQLFSMQWQTSQVIYIPYENEGGIWGKLLISGMIALVCLYISSAGIKAMSRAAVIAAAVGALCIAAAAVTAMKNGHWEYIEPPEGSFMAEFSRMTSLSGSIVSYAVLLRLTGADCKRASAGYFAGRGVLSAVCVITALLVAGGIMEMTDFPVVTASQLSQPFPVQRIDALFVMVFAVFAVFSVAVQTVTAAWLLGEIFPKFTKFRSSFTLVLMIASAFAVPYMRHGSVYSLTAAVLLEFAVPAAVMIKGRRKND